MKIRLVNVLHGSIFVADPGLPFASGWTEDSSSATRAALIKLGDDRRTQAGRACMPTHQMQILTAVCAHTSGIFPLWLIRFPAQRKIRHHSYRIRASSDILPLGAVGRLFIVDSHGSGKNVGTV